MTHTMLRLGLVVLVALAGSVSARDFDKYETCTDCVEAGFGWCPIQRMCGGFANRECGEGERYVKESKKKKKKKKKKSKPEELVTFLVEGKNLTQTIEPSDLFWVLVSQPPTSPPPTPLATSLRNVARVAYHHSPSTSITGYFADKTSPAQYPGGLDEQAEILQWVYDAVVDTIDNRMA